ncbi:hypothetical protein [Salinigranum halophilum]|uniref:hypothetical protein n=1 Tax=Salinigranum halophilum TaxID=2565931 RepID=UPI00115D9F00|nr:hypothetical protein [Salinigranum halophilum]
MRQTVLLPDGGGTQSFESLLRDCKETLRSARNTQSQLADFETPPSRLLDALSECEHEYKELDGEINIGETERQTVGQVATRLELIEAVFTAYLSYHESLVAHDAELYQTWRTGLDELAASTTRLSAIDGVERQWTAVEKLASKGRFAQLATNDRFNLSLLDSALREADSAYRTTVETDPYREYCRTIGTEHRRACIELLNELTEDNPAKVEFGSTLSTCADLLDATAVEKTREGMEGLAMTRYSINRAVARQETAQTLVTELESTLAGEKRAEVDTEALSERAACGDMDAVQAAVVDVVGAAVTRPPEDQLRRQLSAADGSLLAVMNEYGQSLADIQPLLQTMLERNEISDITVQFDE